MIVRLSVVLCLALAAWQTVPASPREHPRLIHIKVDGLPPDLLAALSFPERQDYWDRLPYGDDLRRTLDFYEEETGRSITLPNIRHYFFEHGVYVENSYSETLTLSAAAWAVIDTGQPSVVKGHATFSRDTCYLRSHLDGLRDTIDAIRHGETRTFALWNLDQVGASIMADAFDPTRVWNGPQIYSRDLNRELLLESGIIWLNNDREGTGEIVRSHLSRLVTGIDYAEFAQEMSGLMTARKLLETDLEGLERYDYLSPLFTLMDHKQHVDPHPENLIHWAVKLDKQVGQIFAAVEKSQRKDATIVALVSDHGSEIQPGKTAFSFPITRIFREPLFGGHTVKTLLVEMAWNAVSTPLPGADFPRVYESPHSPYGAKAGGEDGYVTSFIDNFGNGRSSVNLRNNDLNRLHLVLLRLKKTKPGGERWSRLISLFQSTLEETRRWLQPDLALLVDYQEGARDLASQLQNRTDKYALDVARRLQEEVERNAPQVVALQRLLEFGTGDDSSALEKWVRTPFEISDLIPKQYLGLPNRLGQLSSYTLGLDERLQWIESTVDAQGRPFKMNYFEILSSYRAPNAPVNGDYNPYDLIVVSLPPSEIVTPLREIASVEVGPEPLQNVAWVKSTHAECCERGGEALIVQKKSGHLLYLPVKDLHESADRQIRFQMSDGPDPLALLSSRGLSAPASMTRRQWATRFHPRQDWLQATFRTEYGTAVSMLVDIINDPSDRLVDWPEFQSYLTHFSSPGLKERYLRGLRRKYRTQQPDFLVWSDELWNFNSKARTSGGSHSGLRPMVSRTAFVVWGGDATGIGRGQTVSQVATTLDLVPTLFRAAGMLDDRNRLIRDPRSIPERTFLPFPGKVVDIWGGKAGQPSPNLGVRTRER